MIIEREEVKPKPKPKAKSRARTKPTIKITKESAEPVEPINEEPIIEEPEQLKKIYKLKKIVQCPGCGLSMTQHTLLHIHKRRGFCKAIKAEPEKTPEPDQLKPKITEDVVNDYIKQNLDTVSNYLRNERAMKAQRKQMNARSLLNNAF